MGPGETQRRRGRHGSFPVWAHMQQHGSPYAPLPTIYDWITRLCLVLSAAGLVLLSNMTAGTRMAMP
eukprot:4078984-Pyramimonas_sp.AAC.1